MQKSAIIALFLGATSARFIQKAVQNNLSQIEGETVAEVPEVAVEAVEEPVAEESLEIEAEGLEDGLEGGLEELGEGSERRRRTTKGIDKRAYRESKRNYKRNQKERRQDKRDFDYDFDFDFDRKAIAYPEQCDACVEVEPLYTSIEDAIDDSARESQLYGQDGQATVSWEHSGAQSHQGAHSDVYPDIYKKVNGVENNAFKSDRKEREDWSGTRTKTFDIYGSITIDETQEGGLCESVNTCENGTGYNDAES